MAGCDERAVDAQRLAVSKRRLGHAALIDGGER
jgi:hypothetical protein